MAELSTFFKSPAGKAPRAVLGLAADGRIALKPPEPEEPGHVHGTGCGHHHAPKK